MDGLHTCRHRCFLSHIMSLRLSCSGAATARSVAPRACASCTTHSVRLSATVIALLLHPVRLWVPMRTAGLQPFARKLSMDITMDTTLSACKLRRPCCPIPYVIASSETTRDAACAPRGLLGDGHHKCYLCCRPFSLLCNGQSFDNYSLNLADLWSGQPPRCSW